MPDERFIHPAEGESDKLTQLTDFEHRVWIAYKLAANDVGVMLDSPVPIQNGNRNLRNRPAKNIRAAMDAMLKSGLLVRFASQGEQYVCSPRWQDWQCVEWPRQTHLPVPDQSARSKCSEATQKLFETLEANRKERSERIKTGRKKRITTRENLQDDSENLQETTESSQARARDRARNANANANASADAQEGEPEREASSAVHQAPTTLTRSGPVMHVRERRETLIEPPIRHADHVFCWRMCVPNSLHEELIRAAGGDAVKTDAELRVWYPEEAKRWGEKPCDHGDRFKFWKARYADKHRGSSGPRPESLGQRTKGVAETMRRLGEAS